MLVLLLTFYLNLFSVLVCDFRVKLNLMTLTKSRKILYYSPK